MKNRITPCIWFDNNALNAAQFYTLVFPDSEILQGNGMVTQWNLMGLPFMGLNGGPHFKPNTSISFFVEYHDGHIIDNIYTELVKDGMIMMPLGSYPWSEKYGWIQDRFGVGWVFMKGNGALGLDSICPQLMFAGEVNGKVKDAVGFYTGIFKSTFEPLMAKYEPTDQDVVGNIKYAHFKLLDTTIKCMESSMPAMPAFGEGISLVIHCDNQEEIDYYWDKLLLNGGKEQQCGWLKDQFGVSWQIVPTDLGMWMTDPIKGPKVVEAFLKMKKFDIATLINV